MNTLQSGCVRHILSVCVIAEAAFQWGESKYKANATAFRQWRSWLRGADLNRRPLGYAI
jgi:hypothetical protein